MEQVGQTGVFLFHKRKESSSYPISSPGKACSEQTTPNGLSLLIEGKIGISLGVELGKSRTTKPTVGFAPSGTWGISSCESLRCSPQFGRLNEH